MEKIWVVRSLSLGAAFLVFALLGLPPLVREGPQHISDNPLQTTIPEEWIVTAKKITNPLEQMNVKELHITSTAMSIKNAVNTRADMNNMFGNLKGIGWAIVGILLGQFFFQLFKPPNS